MTTLPLRSEIDDPFTGRTQPMRRQMHDIPWESAYVRERASPHTLLAAYMFVGQVGISWVTSGILSGTSS